MHGTLMSPTWQKAVKRIEQRGKRKEESPSIHGFAEASLDHGRKRRAAHWLADALQFPGGLA